MSAKTTFSKPPVSARMHSIKKVLWIVLVLNLAVAAAKFIYGSMTNSSSMQADGIHSIFDSAGNVVGLIGIALASRPADETHPYGHSKFETYASLIIGILLVLAAFEVGSTAIAKLISGVYTVEVTPLSFVVMIVTLAINIGVSFYETKQGKKYQSDVLRADAKHTLSDAFVSCGVIAGLIVVSLGFPIADPIIALIVMIAILFTAIDVFRRGLGTLSDKVRIPENEIRDLVVSVEGVQSAHHIRTRGTEGEIYVDLHVLVLAEMSVLEAHQLCNKIEEKVQNAYEQVTETLIHIEPDDGHTKHDEPGTPT